MQVGLPAAVLRMKAAQIPRQLGVLMTAGPAAIAQPPLWFVQPAGGGQASQTLHSDDSSSRCQCGGTAADTVAGGVGIVGGLPSRLRPMVAVAVPRRPRTRRLLVSATAANAER
eukprot:SAG31_NODE_71_length_28115_cov_4.128105_3_plen_114_part_00